MKYRVEVETIVDGEVYQAGDVVENPSVVKPGMVAMKEEAKAAPAPKAKKKAKKEPEVVEAEEEILVEDSADSADVSVAVTAANPFA